jgi:hypothetical protein
MPVSSTKLSVCSGRDRTKADLGRAPCGCRQYEHRLREIHLEGKGLHRRGIERAGIGEDGEGIAAKRSAGEDVASNVAQA